MDWFLYENGLRHERVDDSMEDLDKAFTSWERFFNNFYRGRFINISNYLLKCTLIFLICLKKLSLGRMQTLNIVISVFIITVTHFYSRIFRVKLNRIARDSTQKYPILARQKKYTQIIQLQREITNLFLLRTPTQLMTAFCRQQLMFQTLEWGGCRLTT